MPTSSPTSITPFFRLQGSTTTQNGFTESGAASLDLTVAQQTTNSLRTTLGADFAAEIQKVIVDFRLGWQHENADTARPMTASFAGAPGAAFTVFGATPQRDSAVIGLAVETHVSDSTELYARYDGEVGGGTDNHAFTAGVHMTW
jgi:outer membrane autotransporter protein